MLASMEWRDEGFVIGVRRHGESSAVIETLTRGHGRHLGLVRGGRSSRSRSLLQPGNTLLLVWRARLDEHLGSFAIEPANLRAGRFLASRLALAAIGWLGALARLLPERDPHEEIYDALSVLAEHLDDALIAPVLIARFEARMLAELGFGLDLSACAATGAREDLIYVSPRSGRAVSAGAGAPYRDRLLPLPAFLRGPRAPDAPDGFAEAPAPAFVAPGRADVLDAFRLTGHFLERDVFGPRGAPLPDARRVIVAALQGELEEAQ
jgi:DNA repair protein RecO (recombination protein O)